MTSGGWIFSILAMIIILALITAAIVWITRELSDRRNRGPGTVMSAREVLDRRLANGEITTKQYDQLRQTLGARADPSANAPRPADAPG